MIVSSFDREAKGLRAELDYGLLVGTPQFGIGTSEHGRDYWQAVGRIMLDYERRRDELRWLGIGLAW